MFSESDGQKLISLARKAISLRFEDKKPDLKDFKQYNEKRGVFVTLTKNGDLRGCIGFPTPVYPLNEAVLNAALSAAFSDPRFRPLTREEFDNIDIEVSVLTVPKLIEADKEEIPSLIKVGRDGLIIKTSFASGLLLPQVAPEWGWNPLELLENTCQKAGLAKDAWKDPSTKILSFQAQIFHEKK